MDHCLIILVLMYLSESGPAPSGEVAESLKFSRKHASALLSRCFRRGFVSRRPYNRGRVRGYIYELAEKGVRWVLYKTSQKSNVGGYDDKPTMKNWKRKHLSTKL